MATINAGIIKIDNKMLLKLLDFEGGTVLGIYTPEGYLNIGYFCAVIEHPDLPEVQDSEKLADVSLTMQSYYGEDGSLLKLERIQPEKKPIQI